MGLIGGGNRMQWMGWAPPQMNGQLAQSQAQQAMAQAGQDQQQAQAAQAAQAAQQPQAAQPPGFTGQGVAPTPLQRVMALFQRPQSNLGNVNYGNSLGFGGGGSATPLDSVNYNGGFDFGG